MKIKYEDHDILYPFGEYIYRSKVDADGLKFMQDLAESSREGDDASKSLVGNIKEQRHGMIKNQQDVNNFDKIFRPHLKNYMDQINRTANFVLEEDSERSQHERENTPFWKIVNGDYEKLSYSLNQGPWFNYMKKYEFNPLHNHHGEISAICMVKVPEEIQKEAENDADPNWRAGGKLEFVSANGQASPHRVVSREADVYMFPSILRHQVYPYKSDVERITCSWNYYNINYPSLQESSNE
tara:strand:+ start:374 stop:1093 length:720 start_codon:yes stop_codon:yes gene_type:complete